MRVNARSITLLLALPLFSTVLAATGPESSGGTLTLSPEEIHIGFFYSGSSVLVEGPAQDGSDVIVVIRGPDGEESFNKKVRAGPIWISSGQVHITGAPSLFLSYTPKPLESILPPESILENELAPAAVRPRMVIDAGDDVVDEEVMADSFIALKTQDDVYQVHIGDETAATVSGGRFSLRLDWPRTATPAEYEVAAYECRDREIVRVSKAQLRLVKVGAPARIHDFSLNSPAQYGALAVVLALLGGFGIDFLVSRVFGGKVSAH